MSVLVVLVYTLAAIGLLNVVGMAGMALWIYLRERDQHERAARQIGGWR